MENKKNKILKIAIDIRELKGEKVGIGQFTYNLIKYLSRIDDKNIYFLYTDSKKDLILPHLKGNFKFLSIETPSFLWHFKVYKDILSKNIDIFLAPRSYIIPSFDFLNKSIIIVHDCLPFLRSKEKLPLKPKIIPLLTFKQALKRAKRIIAVSQNTKKDIIRLFKIKKKIFVVYEGVSEEFKPRKDEKKLEEIRNKYRLPKKFILFVGTLEPRKNLVRLIEAYYQLDHFKKEYKLIIAGKKGWYFEEIFKKVYDLKLEKDVIFLGYVPDSDLPFIYNLAEIFIYPSIYEGFGLPVLEAMASGVPVITSNTSSLPEIVKDCGILINPFSIKEIKNSLLTLIKNDSLREDLKNKGLKRAKEFSWEKTAKKIKEIFENATTQDLEIV